MVGHSGGKIKAQKRVGRAGDAAGRTVNANKMERTEEEGIKKGKAVKKKKEKKEEGKREIDRYISPKGMSFFRQLHFFVALPCNLPVTVLC
jgi:hypothetical protein